MGRTDNGVAWIDSHSGIIFGGEKCLGRQEPANVFTRIGSLPEMWLADDTARRCCLRRLPWTGLLIDDSKGSKHVFEGGVEKLTPSPLMV